MTTAISSFSKNNKPLAVCQPFWRAIDKGYQINRESGSATNHFPGLFYQSFYEFFIAAILTF
jgi:hypothetical protein